MNPAMSAWVALGAACPSSPVRASWCLAPPGTPEMAVQVAKRLGAGRVVGRRTRSQRLAALASVGADEVVALTATSRCDGACARPRSSQVDIVIDYLWGRPARHAMMALLARGRTAAAR